MFNDTVEVMAEAAWDAGWPGTDLGGLRDSLPARPRLLGLGEPMHAVEEFRRARHELFRQLVAGAGYRSIAIESDSLAALVVDEYVAGGPGSLEEVLRAGFSHGFGASTANRELVAWLRESNPDREAPVRFYGFDAPTEITAAPSPRGPLTALHTYLATHLTGVPGSAADIAGLAGDDARWTDPAAMFDASRSVGRSAEAVRLRLLADDLGALLLAESPRLIPESGDEWWRANLHARTATGLLRFHAAMADPSPRRISRLAALRNGMMAENLAAIAEREAGRGPPSCSGTTSTCSGSCAPCGWVGWTSRSWRWTWVPHHATACLRRHRTRCKACWPRRRSAGTSTTRPAWPARWATGYRHWAPGRSCRLRSVTSRSTRTTSPIPTACCSSERPSPSRPPAARISLARRGRARAVGRPCRVEPTCRRGRGSPTARCLATQDPGADRLFH
jgi:Erythromycin esterase